MINFYITESDLPNNLNTAFGLNSQLQTHLACQNTQFIIQLSRDLKTSYSIPTLALHISTIFFHKKSYLNYDRFLILTASYLLSSKIKNMDCRVKNLCNALHNVLTRKTMSVEPFSEQKMKRLKQLISIYETQILRTLEYDIDSVTPHDYLKRDCELLFPGERETNKRILTTTRIIILDSYRSRCCLVFTPLVIFVTCFLIANRYEGKKPQQLLWYQAIALQLVLLARRRLLVNLTFTQYGCRLQVQGRVNKLGQLLQKIALGWLTPYCQLASDPSTYHTNFIIYLKYFVQTNEGQR